MIVAAGPTGSAGRTRYSGSRRLVSPKTRAMALLCTPARRDLDVRDADGVGVSHGAPQVPLRSVVDLPGLITSVRRRHRRDGPGARGPDHPEGVGRPFGQNSARRRPYGVQGLSPPRTGRDSGPPTVRVQPVARQMAGTIVSAGEGRVVQVHCLPTYRWIGSCGYARPLIAPVPVEDGVELADRTRLVK